MYTGAVPRFVAGHAVAPQYASMTRTIFRSAFRPHIADFPAMGFLMAGITARKQTLHDMFAGCLVLRR